MHYTSALYCMYCATLHRYRSDRVDGRRDPKPVNEEDDLSIATPEFSTITIGLHAGVGQAVAHVDPARSRELRRRLILDSQDCLTRVERCRKPVLAAMGERRPPRFID